MYSEIGKIKFIEELKKEVNKEAYANVKYYQKIYNFKIGEGKHDTWNNEADAFKHTFSSAWLIFKYNLSISKIFCDFHEGEGRESNQDIAEEVMDLHNNRIGRNIAEQIKKDYPHWKKLPERELKDIIAKRVVEKMRNDELINNPDESYKKALGEINKRLIEIKDVNKRIREEHLTKIPEPITEVNEIIKKNHESKLLPKNHKPMFTQPQKQITLHDLYNDAQNVLTNTVLFPLYLNNKGLSHEENIKNNFPRMLKAVSKINKIPVNNVMNIIQNKINSHSDKLNNNRQNSFNGINGFNTFNNNNVPINTVNYNLTKYYQPSAINSVPLEMSNNYVNPIMNNNYPKANMTSNIPEPVDFSGLFDLAKIMIDIYKSKKEKPIPQPTIQPTPQPLPQQGYEYYPY